MIFTRIQNKGASVINVPETLGGGTIAAGAFKDVQFSMQEVGAAMNVASIVAYSMTQVKEEQINFGEHDEVIYVATTGNDNNDGSALSPLRNIQAAFAKIPQVWKKSVRVQFGAGNFPINGMGAVRFGSAIGAGASPVQIVGTPADQLGELTALGSSADNAYVATITTALDAYRGAYLRNLETGGRALITGNTPSFPSPGQTTFYLVGEGLSVSEDDVFVVERPGTVFQVGAFEVLDIGHGTGEVGFGMRDIKVQVISNTFIGIPFYVSIGFNFYEACEFNSGGSNRGIYTFHNSRWNNASEAVYWMAAPDNPFDGNRYQAGLYLNGSGSSTFFSMADRCSASGGSMVMDNAGFYLSSLSGWSFDYIDTKGSVINVGDLSTMGIGGGKMVENIDSIFIEGHSNVDVAYSYPLEVIDGEASAFVLRSRSTFRVWDEGLIGTGNDGYGIVLAGGSALFSQGFAEVEGTDGQVLVGAVSKDYDELPFGEVDADGPTGNRAE